MFNVGDCVEVVEDSKFAGCTGVVKYPNQPCCIIDFFDNEGHRYLGIFANMKLRLISTAGLDFVSDEKIAEFIDCF